MAAVLNIEDLSAPRAMLKRHRAAEAEAGDRVGTGCGITWRTDRA